MRFHNTSNKKAFSLIELSIVVLIIGIIIAGITKSSQVLDLYKLSSARTQTQSSPVNSIKNLLVWYEATSENSFIEKETDDFASLTAADITLGKGIISTWFDISSTAGAKDNLTQTTSTARPQYLSNCINDLPCVNFDGTDDILNFAGSKITDIENSNYTIFIINKKTSTDNSSELIIGTTSPQNEALSIGYDKNNNIIHIYTTIAAIHDSKYSANPLHHTISLRSLNNLFIDYRFKF